MLEKVVIPFKSGLFFEFKGGKNMNKYTFFYVVIPFKSGLFFE